MAEAKQAAFEGWAMVELMGHQREIVYVTTEAYGQAVMFRVDTPELPEREYILERPQYCEVDGASSYTGKGAKVKRPAVPAKSRLIAPGALYAINPCTEEAARLAIDQSAQRDLILVEAPPQKALPAPGEEDANDLEDQQEEEEEFSL